MTEKHVTFITHLSSAGCVSYTQRMTVACSPILSQKASKQSAYYCKSSNVRGLSINPRI